MATNYALKSSEDFFLHVLEANYKTFFENSSTFANAINLATSLFHFHEWLFEEHKPKLEAKFSKTFKGKGEFWGAVEAINKKHGYIRDLANASKHVQIGGGRHKPSTGMRHIANTHIVTVGFDEGAFGVGAFGGAPSVELDDQGQSVDFDECAQALYDYWRILLGELTGRSY